MKREEINGICDEVRSFTLALEAIIRRSQTRNESTKTKILGKLIRRTGTFLADLIELGIEEED